MYQLLLLYQLLHSYAFVVQNDEWVGK